MNEFPPNGNLGKKGDETMEITTVFWIAYSVWAVYSGYKWINGRYEWLEQPELSNRICKVLAILGVGYFVGAWNIGKWVVMLAIRLTDGFR